MFQPGRPTIIQIDASKSWIGFVMFQVDEEGNKNTVMDVLRFLSEVEARYCILELECQAIYYSFKKAHYYVAGGPKVTFLTDHNPLTIIFNEKHLPDVENMRCRRLKYHLQGYDFTVELNLGKDNEFPAMLSKHPITLLSRAYLEVQEDIELEMVAAVLSSTPDPMIEHTVEAAGKDEEYSNLCRLVVTGGTATQGPGGHLA